MQNIFGSILELENHGFKVIRPELINGKQIYVEWRYPSKESLENVDASNVAAVSWKYIFLYYTLRISWGTEKINFVIINSLSCTFRSVPEALFTGHSS